MKIPFFQVDAFAEKQFHGNPAGVCRLESWLPDEVLQQIAEENNLSETAFFVKKGTGFHLRWFTPVTEVELCGHATLATAHVLWNHLNYKEDVILFDSQSGALEVKRTDQGMEMNFPLDTIEEVTSDTDVLVSVIGGHPTEVWKGKTDYLLVYNSQSEITSLSPRFRALKNLDIRGVIVTAPGYDDDVDVVSRFFCPAVGINEDHVTGSAHTTLGAYWPRRLSSKCFSAHQLSRRGGSLFCEIQNNRIMISGKAVTYMEGTIKLH
jgi:PhzF family phenazine biosynthesis protein